MAKWFNIYIVLLFLPYILYSQRQDFKFERITTEQGLSHAAAKSVLQDNRGFIWIGTEHGLNRYDGYTIKTFTHDPENPNTISDNYIQALYEDPEEKGKVLWIGTKSGLNRLDLENEHFTRFLHDSGDSTSLSQNSVTSICKDDGGFLWIGTWSGGLNMYNKETGEFTRFQNDPNNPHSLNDNRVVSVYQDKDGNLWIGTFGCLNKLDQSDVSTGKGTEAPLNVSQIVFEHYCLDKSGGTINDIFEDHAGELWIASPMGLCTFDRKTKQFNHRHFRSDINKTATVRRANSIFEDAAGELWFATIGQGLVHINSERDQLISYQHDPTSSENFIPATDMISQAIVDKTGVIWIAAWEFGVIKLLPNRKKFRHFKHIPGDTTSIIGNKIVTICEDKDGEVWVGTFNERTNKFDKDKNQFVLYSIHSRHMCRSKSGELWVTSGRILRKFNPKNGKFVGYVGSKIYNSSMPANYFATNLDEIISLYYVFEDSEGTLWCLIGHTSSGKTVFQFDERKREFSPYKILSDKEISSDVNLIHEDRSGALWFGTSRNGLIQRSISEKDSAGNKKYKFVQYKNDRNNSSSISSNIIHAICEDAVGYLWIGTEAGLNKYDPASRTFQYFQKKDGLSSDLIFAILDDDNRNLWLGTNKGISKFNLIDETFKNYDKSDGLLSTYYGGFGASCKSGGLLFFGSPDGLTVFSPDEIKENLSIPNLFFTDFKIFNKSVSPGADSPLKKSISSTNKIALSHDQSVFSFEFAALDFTAPEKNQYTYKMEGVDPDWVYTDASRRFATYTNLDPGEYIFRVKGSNNDGIWNEDGTSIKITILPPWWRTNWAYSFYVLLILSVVYGVWRFQTNRLKIKQQMEMEHFEAEKLREVDHLKSRFFANISHEFRTPLTLIQGPVRQIFSGEFNGNLKETSGMILRYSDRLLNLINQILDLSKLESGRMTLKVSCTDVTQFLKGIVQSFASLAERNKIALKLHTDNESATGYVDNDKLEKIVTNLLSNAFKFTPEGGTVEVNVSLRGDSRSEAMETTKQSRLSERNEIASPASRRVRNYGSATGGIQVKIFNSGAGIPPDQLDKIFDRFYQADESYTKDSEGTGIGLALTKELVEAHHGELRVKSEMNKGITFTVWLPIERKHFKPEEIVDIPLSPLDEVVDPSKGETKITPLVREDSFGEGGARRAGDVYADILTEKLVEKASHPKSAPLLLIVEDNPDVTAYISSFLQDDYRIITAENGESGLKKVLEKFPHLVISDVMMPVMDGFELCRKLKSDQNTSHIPVILLTAKADMESKIDGLEFGADDYVTKPFDAKELHVRVRNLIEQRKMLHEKFSRMIEVKPGEIAANSMDEQFLERLLNIFEDHVDQSDFSTEDFAREVGMSRSSLHRKLQAVTNQPTHEFLRTLRLKRAAQLLQQSAGTVTEIAYAVGFNSPSHFSRIFRQQFGQTPSEFASKNQNIENPEKNDI